MSPVKLKFSERSRYVWLIPLADKNRFQTELSTAEDKQTAHWMKIPIII